MSVKFQDYYETLGVARDASQDDIKRAYRKLARKYHPDVSKEPDAEAKFKQVAEAYEVLGDADNRKKYDRLGRDWRAGERVQPPPGWGAGGQGVDFDFGDMGGVSDFFRAFFGQGGFGGAGGARHRRPAGAARRKGADVRAEIEVTLEEAFEGGKTSFTLVDAQGNRKSYEVELPRGVKDGARLRLRGQGGASRSGGAAGDLYLTIRVSPHPVFTRSGDELEAELRVTAWHAALGATLPVTTLDGEVQLRLPAGTGSGRRLRLRGRGMPGKGGKRGDLYLRVSVQVPPELTAEERQLFEELRDVSRFTT